MSKLRDILQTHVSNGSVPGAVGLIARGDQVEVQAAGSADVDGTSPMARDSIFRVASITKPIIAAAVMMLVEDGRIALEDPVGRWLPELASPVVVRTPAGPVDDVVPAVRPITVADLLTFRAGYGFPSDFSLPAVGLLFSELKQGPPQPQLVAAPDEWMAALARIPLLYQPGEAWLYDTCSDIQGVLIARVSGRPLPEFLAERLFGPLGMADTGFEVPAGKLGRFTSYYRADPAGGLGAGRPPWRAVEQPPGVSLRAPAAWSRPPATGTPSPGCCSPAGRRGRRLLSPESVRQMTTDQLTPSQRDAGRLFLEGQGWGFGGSVDVEAIDPWNVPGRYGWVGGTGTAAHITPPPGRSPSCSARWNWPGRRRPR